MAADKERRGPGGTQGRLFREMYRLVLLLMFFSFFLLDVFIHLHHCWFFVCAMFVFDVGSTGESPKPNFLLCVTIKIISILEC